MWKLKTDLVFFLLTLLFITAASAADVAIDPEMKRKVLLALKPEPNAKIYLLQIRPAKGKVMEFTQAGPIWQDYLAKGNYFFRGKVVFADETESKWSDWRGFSVADYKINLENVDAGIAKIEDSKFVLSWTKLSDAVSYTATIYQVEEYSISTESINRNIQRNKNFNDKPIFESREISKNEVEIKQIPSGKYRIKIVAFDGKNKIIGIGENVFEAFEIAKLIPKIKTPSDEFVREIAWFKVADFDKYGVAVYKKGDEGAIADKVERNLFSGTVFKVPSAWPGGDYSFCVKTHIGSITYSKESCIDFKVKEGDRSKLAENRYYREIIKHKNKQYYHHFNIIGSTIQFKSEFPSLSSVVSIDGPIMNLSYSKSDPGFFEGLNQYYGATLGFFKLPSKNDFLYDFRYGQEYSFYQKYPAIFKVNGGLGLDKVVQATTDARSATQLNVFSQNLLNVFLNGSLEYVYLDRYAVNFRVGYLTPVSQLTRSQDQYLSSGSSYDFSISGLFYRTSNNDRFEIGYLNRSSVYRFKTANLDEENKTSQTGHYFNVGYIMEAK